MNYLNQPSCLLFLFWPEIPNLLALCSSKPHLPFTFAHREKLALWWAISILPLKTAKCCLHRKRLCCARSWPKESSRTLLYCAFVSHSPSLFDFKKFEFQLTQPHYSSWEPAIFASKLSDTSWKSTFQRAYRSGPTPQKSHHLRDTNYCPHRQYLEVFWTRTTLEVSSPTVPSLLEIQIVSWCSVRHRRGPDGRSLSR